MKKKVWMLAGLVSIAGAITLLAAGGLSENMVFFLTPSELHAKGAEIYGAPMRLGGQVKPGTIDRDLENGVIRFTMQENDVEVAVESTGTPTAMFGDGIGVVVEGTYSEDRVFRATSILVKHSNEYAPPEHVEDARETYKSLLEGS
ncbi:MAG: cytochrome c maturation protein CcmE [Gemmatimonadetes bacterium]|nr:cytochrome c maturation protein CcmE [Gemmatimonadota bacterium]